MKFSFEIPIYMYGKDLVLFLQQMKNLFTFVFLYVRMYVVGIGISVEQ